MNLLFNSVNNLIFADDAEMLEISLPSVAVCWSDEILSMQETMKLQSNERKNYYLLFSLRVKIWLNEPFTADQEKLWSQANEFAPNWPLFKRLTPSSEIIKSQKELEDSVFNFLDAFKKVDNEKDI